MNLDGSRWRKNRARWACIPCFYRRQIDRHYSVILPLHSNPNDYFGVKRYSRADRIVRMGRLTPNNTNPLHSPNFRMRGCSSGLEG